MEQILMSKHNMSLPTLEAVTDQLILELEGKTADIIDLDFHWVSKTVANNREIIARLHEIRRLQEDTMLSHQ